MKTSLLTSSLAMCVLASSALASPLEARDGRTRTITTTETDTEYVTRYKTRTVTDTETDTLVETKTKTETLEIPTTVTKTKTTETVSTSTVTVQKPASTSYVTKTIQGPVSTKTVQGPTVTSVSTLKASTVKTVTSLSTTTMPAQTVTASGKTVTSLSTTTMPAQTVTASGKTVTSLSTTTMPAQTVTASGKTVTSLSTKVIPGTTITAPGTTAYVTSISTVPGPTITDFLTATIQGPTVTAVSTSYVNVNNGTDVTMTKAITSWLTSACASSTSLGLNSLNMTTTATSSSVAAAATTNAVSYENVITDQCDDPKAYYIQIDNSGTAYDGTVLLNEDKGRDNMWVTYSAPSTDLGEAAAQPFIFDESTGTLTSYWNNDEALEVYPQGGGDTRAGFIGSLDGLAMLSCTLEGSQLTNCGSSFTGTFLAGLRVEDDGFLRVNGGYNYASDYNATYSLIPACDI